MLGGSVGAAVAVMTWPPWDRAVAPSFFQRCRRARGVWTTRSPVRSRFSGAHAPAARNAPGQSVVPLRSGAGAFGNDVRRSNSELCCHRTRAGRDVAGDRTPARHPPGGGGAAHRRDPQHRPGGTGAGGARGGRGGFWTLERGFQDRGRALSLLLVGCVGGVLLLGGAPSAALLARSDAQSDFAMLLAVGAPPGVRRSVIGDWSSAIGHRSSAIGHRPSAIGLLGAVAGPVPGVAVSIPSTRTATTAAGQPSSFLDISWLLVRYVVLDISWLLVRYVVLDTPLLAALGAAGLTRSCR